MKKALSVFAAGAVIALLCFASCSKKCTCKTPAGIFEGDIEEVDKRVHEYDNGAPTVNNCSDVTLMGWKCETK